MNIIGPDGPSNFSTPSTFVTVTNLVPNTTYAVFIQIVTPESNLLTSESEQFRTSEFQCSTFDSFLIFMRYRFVIACRYYVNYLLTLMNV